MRFPAPLAATRAFLCAIVAVALLPAERPARLDETRYLADVKRLASEKMHGRETGSPELDEAGAYIASQFRLLGLQPVGPRGYYQPLPVTTDARLSPDNRLAFRTGDEQKELKLGRDYTPFGFSASAKVSGQVVFAGYGISAPEYGYDDYAGVSVAGKIVVILRHEPQEYDRESAFSGKVYTEHAQLFAKSVNARRHGARALLLVNDTAQHGGGPGDLTEFSGLPGPANTGIPVLHLSADVVRQWFRLAGRDWPGIQRAINKDLTPRSFAFPESLKVRIRSHINSRQEQVRNVAGYLPGNTSEYVILGAHYDHIGTGRQFSMAPEGAGRTHPGADDNASGTAGLLELARWFGNRPPAKRGVLFLAFTAEELGLLGSGYYVRHPLLPLSDAVAMVNMDMIGRIRNRRVYVGGIRTGSTLRQVLDQHRKESGLDLDYSESVGYGSSDHTSFTTRRVPVLFFFSGLHGDYHRPGDTWDKIEGAEAVRLLGYIANVVEDLANRDSRPHFIASGSVGDSTH